MKTPIITYTKKDFRVDTYRGTGAGGQHRNKTDSCVRITHIPTGLISSCCEHRGQGRNKSIAFNKLGKLVLQWHRQQDAVVKERNTSVVRTYNAADNRVVNHSTGFKQPYSEVMNDISDMVKNQQNWGLTNE